MEGEDVNDSNCIDFSKVGKVRDQTRHSNCENVSTSLKGVRIGIVKEFDIEELDPRNR